MKSTKINLEKVLSNKQQKLINSVDLLKEVKGILNKDEEKIDIISNKLKNEYNATANNFNFDLLETNKIFHISAIKSICVDYRLRFLDSHLFKSEIPEEAKHKIKNLQSLHQTDLNGFKIMAPAKLFKLKNYDDPFLFAPIGNNYYYLIHKWGNDMSAFRKLTAYPFKNLGTILIFLTLISVLTTIVLPISKFGPSNINVTYFISFLFIFKSYCAIFLYYCFWKGKNFSTENWNSKYYNT